MGQDQFARFKCLIGDHSIQMHEAGNSSIRATGCNGAKILQQGKN
jgi:hypothetical protein